MSGINGVLSLCQVIKTKGAVWGNLDWIEVIRLQLLTVLGGVCLAARFVFAHSYTATLLMLICLSTLFVYKTKGLKISLLH